MSDATKVQEVRDRVLKMTREIEEMSRTTSDPGPFFAMLLERAVTALGAVGGAAWLINDNKQVELVQQYNLDKTGFHDNPAVPAANHRLITEVLMTGESSCKSPTEDHETPLPTNHVHILAAILDKEKCVGALQIFQRPHAEASAFPGFLQFMEQMAGYASRFVERQGEAPVEQSTQEFHGGMEEFLYELHRNLEPTDVASTACNDGRVLLACDRLSLAVRRGRKTRIVAISGQDRVNHRANLVQNMSKLADKVIRLGETVTFGGKMEELPPQIEKPMAEFIQVSESRFIHMIPLFETRPPKHEEADHKTRKKRKTTPRKAFGCLVVEQVSRAHADPRLAERSELLAEHVGTAYYNALNHSRIFMLRTWQALGRSLEWFQGRKLWKTLAILLCLAAVVLSLIFVPWDYRVEGEGRLMPVRQQAVFAPWNGKVVEIFVEDGQPVEEGDQLFRLQNPDLEEELLATRNDLRGKLELELTLQSRIDDALDAADTRTEKELRGELIETRIAAQGLQEQLEILERRQKSLLVEAPISGTVAAFQIEQRLRDRPVNRGEMLLEVMDPRGDWRLQLEVEERRMGHLRRAQLEHAEEEDGEQLPVEFILATATESTFTGKLTDLATRSDLSPESGNIVEVHASIDPDQQLPEKRIGAEVRAKINCGQRSLGYVIFGDVIEFFQKLMWF